MAENKALTHTDSEKGIHLKIKFRIEKFEALMNTTEPGEGRLWSEGVVSELAPRAVWKLKVCPNGWKEEHRGNVFIYLCLTGPMHEDGKTLDATFHLYLVDESGGSKIDVGMRCTKNFGTNGWGTHTSHDQVKNALQADGSLLVAADIEFLPPNDSGAKAISEDTLRGYEDQQRRATNFFKFYDNQASSDCSIEIGGASIQAHKSILAAHSPIFRSMFSHPEAEEFQSSVVKVTDFKEPAPMRALVRYCYMGQLDTETMDGEGAVEIFKLADRYCITELKAQLEKHFVSKRLSVENVVAMAVLADMHSALKLKEACIKLIAEEGNAVYENAEWKELQNEKIIELADKYSIAGLKPLLEKHFVDKRLGVENVIEMAKLADAHSAAKLKEACLKLIARECETVFDSADWKEMMESRPKLAAELAVAATKLLVKTIYESAVWKELIKTRPELATNPAIEAFHVLSKKG